MVRLVDHLAGAVESEDVVAHGTRPAALHLVLVAKQLLARVAPSIVQLAVGQHAQKRGLAGVHVAHHRHADLHKVLAVDAPSDEELGRQSLLGLALPQLHAVRIEGGGQRLQRGHCGFILLRGQAVVHPVLGQPHVVDGLSATVGHSVGEPLFQQLELVLVRADQHRLVPDRAVVGALHGGQVGESGLHGLL